MSKDANINYSTKSRRVGTRKGRGLNKESRNRALDGSPPASPAIRSDTRELEEKQAESFGIIISH